MMSCGVRCMNCILPINTHTHWKYRVHCDFYKCLKLAKSTQSTQCMLVISWLSEYIGIQFVHRRTSNRLDAMRGLGAWKVKDKQTKYLNKIQKCKLHLNKKLSSVLWPILCGKVQSIDHAIPPCVCCTSSEQYGTMLHGGGLNKCDSLSCDITTSR